MRRPERKTLRRLLSKELLSLFQKALYYEYGSKVYDKPMCCPHCNDTKAWRYDTRHKIFCRIVSGNNFKDVKVAIVRYQCSKCRKVFYPEMPFYPNCNYGRPIVDFCLFLASYYPYNRVERILFEHGIQVDRVIVKKYVGLFGKGARNLSGSVKLSGKDMGVNFLRLFFGVSDIAELREKYGQTMIQGMA